MGIKEKIKSAIAKMHGVYNTQELIAMGLTVGKNFSRQQDVIIDHSHCWLITIGDNVTMAPRSYILAHDATTKNKHGYTKIGCVEIADNVFVGAGAIIMPGVSIGKNSIIAAGSVVTKSIPANSVAGGNPAKVITTFERYTEKIKEGIATLPKFDKSYTLNGNITSEKKKEMKEKLMANGGVGFVD